MLQPVLLMQTLFLYFFIMQSEISNNFLVQTHILLKLKLIYDRQTVGQSVLVSGTHMGPTTSFSFSLQFTVAGLLFCSALSDERADL
jgi:hypothetical protein